MKKRYTEEQIIKAIKENEALGIAKASLTNQTTNTGQRAKESLKGLLEIGRLVLTGDKYALV